MPIDDARPALRHQEGEHERTGHEQEPRPHRRHRGRSHGVARHQHWHALHMTAAQPPRPDNTMSATIHFDAPWGTSLKVISIAASTIVAGLLVFGIVEPGLPAVARAILVALMTALLIGPVPFVVRGYRLNPDALLIERLGWCTRIPLSGLRSPAGGAHSAAAAHRIASGPPRAH